MNTLAVLKALSDDTRLRIVSLIVEAEDLCACEVEAILGLNQSNASRHLGRLVRCGIIAAEKKGQWVHYSCRPLEEPSLGFVREAVDTVRKEGGGFGSDLERLAEYRGSGFSCRNIKDWKPNGSGATGKKNMSQSYSA